MTATSSDHDAPTVADTAPVTVEQAAAILGVSITTIRRRIRAGSLRAEEARRPQGPVWLVYLPPGATPATASEHEVSTVVGTAATTTPAADAMVSLIQTTIGTILGPLVGQLDAQRQTIERQAEQLVTQAETIGRQGAELERAASTIIALEARTASQPAPAPRELALAQWRSWGPWLLTPAVLACVMALLAWPR